MKGLKIRVPNAPGYTISPKATGLTDNLILILLLVTFIPQFSMWLPNLIDH